MVLTDSQNDALTELINIGYARAAGALSTLTGHRVTLAVPKVSVHDIDNIAPVLRTVLPNDVITVNQVFSGPVSGNALLLLDGDAASMLSHLLADFPSGPGTLSRDEREVITEVGNILLNACLAVFGNLLKVHVRFSVPHLHVERVEEVLRSMVIGDEELDEAMMVHTRFHVRANDVSGYLVILVGVTSLDRLMYELDRWSQRQLE
jgi:chemotaxis protein CheC